MHASSLAAFQAHGEMFLLVSFSGDGERYDIASVLYKLDTQGTTELPHTGETIAGSGFEVMMSVPSVGAMDVEHVSIKVGAQELRHILLIANGESVGHTLS